MKMSLPNLSLIAFLLLGVVGCQTQRAASVLGALPKPDELGAGWTRDISMLLDPASRPSEIFDPSSCLAETFKERQRAAIRNPASKTSGWAHVHYGAKSGRRLEVQIECYRDQKVLAEEFHRLLAYRADNLTPAPVAELGDGAVEFADTRNGTTVWFCRNNYLVWISPLTSAKPWQEDADLQNLAHALDARMCARK